MQIFLIQQMVHLTEFIQPDLLFNTYKESKCFMQSLQKPTSVHSISKFTDGGLIHVIRSQTIS